MAGGRPHRSSPRPRGHRSGILHPTRPSSSHPPELRLLLHRMVARETSITGFLSASGIPAGSEEISRLARYAEILATRAISEGFLGPNEGQRILRRHIYESLAL